MDGDFLDHNHKHKVAELKEFGVCKITCKDPEEQFPTLQHYVFTTTGTKHIHPVHDSHVALRCFYCISVKNNSFTLSLVKNDSLSKGSKPSWDSV